VKLCAELRPDLVLMDIQMPELDGLQATEAIMAQSPTPILVITADPFRNGVDLSFRALSAGALDLMAKPETVPWPDASRRDFLRKIRLLSQVPVVRHMRGRKQPAPMPALLPTTSNPAPVDGVVGIIASTGGPRSLGTIMAELDASFPAPILVVQHIMPGFSAHLADWLNRLAALEVVEAKVGMRMERGKVYIASADTHLELGPASTLRVHEDAPVSGHRPSGDLLLESLAKFAGPKAVGLVMSGMGSDGTLGLAAVGRAGGRTLVQDKESSVVYGMPQSAIDLGVVQRIVKLEEIASVLRTEILDVQDKE
jgi:two-component system chemotaxis response regulator CheB